MTGPYLALLGLTGPYWDLLKGLIFAFAKAKIIKSDLLNEQVKDLSPRAEVWVKSHVCEKTSIPHMERPVYSPNCLKYCGDLCGTSKCKKRCNQVCRYLHLLLTIRTG